MTHSKCEQELAVPCYFFDVNRTLRPASFFDLAQEVAVQGATMIGAPDSVLMKRGLVWILIRMHVHYEGLPTVGDSVRLQTWHSGVTGPLYTRDYLMLDQGGKTLVRATSSWALMEVSTRSIAKAERIFDIMPPEPQWPERVMDANAPKIIWPRGAAAEASSLHTVMYSDVDYNGHANNARYPVWAFDSLPPELTTKNRLSDFYINYNRELHLGETTELVRTTRESGSFIIEGRSNGQQNFICRLDFLPNR